MSVYSHIKRIAPGIAAFALKAMCVAPTMFTDDQETESAVDFSFLYLEFPDELKTRLKLSEFDLRNTLLDEIELLGAGDDNISVKLEFEVESPTRAVLMNRDVNELDEIVDYHGNEKIAPLSEEILGYNLDSELGKKRWTMTLLLKATDAAAGGSSFESTLQLSNTISDGEDGTVRIQTDELPLDLFTGGATAADAFGAASAGIVNPQQLDRALFGLYGNLPHDEYEELLARTREQIENHLPAFVREKAEIAAETHNLVLPTGAPAGASPSLLLIVDDPKPAIAKRAASSLPDAVQDELGNYLEIALTVLADKAWCEVISEKIDVSGAETTRLYGILNAYLNPPT